MYKYIYTYHPRPPITENCPRKPVDTYLQFSFKSVRIFKIKNARGKGTRYMYVLLIHLS